MTRAAARRPELGYGTGQPTRRSQWMRSSESRRLGPAALVSHALSDRELHWRRIPGARCAYSSYRTALQLGGRATRPRSRDRLRPNCIITGKLGAEITSRLQAFFGAQWPQIERYGQRQGEPP